MGTWGTGPFDSDTAEDLADSLEDLPAEERMARVDRVLRRAIDAGDSEKLPGEVIAAAAVIASNLPPGINLPWNEDYEGISEWLPKPVPTEFTARAIQALDRALPADGWYWRSWTDDNDRREAEDVVNAARSALCASPQ